MSSSLNIFQIDHHHHHYHDDQWCVLGGRRDDGVLNLGAKFAGNVTAQKPCIQQVMMMVIIIMVMVMIIAMVIRMVMVIMVMMMKMVRIMVMAVMIIMEPHSTSVILNCICGPYLCILHFEIWFQELKPIFSKLSAFSSGIHCEIFVGQLFDIVWLCQLLSEKDLPPLPPWSSSPWNLSKENFEHRGERWWWGDNHHGVDKDGDDDDHGHDNGHADDHRRWSQVDFRHGGERARSKSCESCRQPG